MLESTKIRTLNAVAKSRTATKLIPIKLISLILDELRNLILLFYKYSATRLRSNFGFQREKEGISLTRKVETVRRTAETAREEPWPTGIKPMLQLSIQGNGTEIYGYLYAGAERETDLTEGKQRSLGPSVELVKSKEKSEF